MTDISTDIENPDQPYKIALTNLELYCLYMTYIGDLVKPYTEVLIDLSFNC